VISSTFAIRIVIALTAATLVSSPFFYASAQLVDLGPVLNDTSGNDTQGPDDNTTSPEPPVIPQQAPPANQTLPPPDSDDIGPSEPVGTVSASPCLEYDEEEGTVEILCDADIIQLFNGLRDDSITQHLGGSEMLLKANITVDDGATFTIDSGKGIDTLRIEGSNGITVFGKIQIHGFNITSWDSEDEDVIRQNADGSIPRAYLFLSGSDGGEIADSELSHMGYVRAGYRGVDLMHGSHDFAVTNSTFHNMWYAFYSSEAYNLTISSSEYYENLQYAIDPHTGTNDVLITNNTLHDNRVGLVCSLDCSNIVFEYNTVHDNDGPGIFFSRNTHDSIARYNNIYNQPVGLAFSESPNNQAYGNNLTSLGRAVFLGNPENTDDGFTTGNLIYNNTIGDSDVGVMAFATEGNTVADNHFYNISISHYRLNSSASITIDSQTFDNAIVEGQDGDNTVLITNSGPLQVNGTSTDIDRNEFMLSDEAIIVDTVTDGE
jgi:mannuronan 5-epimerase